MDAKHWQAATRWDDPSVHWYRGDDGVSIALLDIGAPEEVDRPLVMLVEYAPGTVVRAHHHDTDYCSIVVRGEVEITGRVHTTGSVRRVAAGTTYGPLVAGPEGTTLIDFFTDRSGAAATWADRDPEVQAFGDRARRNLERLIATLDERPVITRPHRRA